VKHAGFESQSAAESIRRLTVLVSLQKGTLCREKTWGFGVVQRVDDFYGRVTIDFDSKRGHEMALSYAWREAGDSAVGPYPGTFASGSQGIAGTC
jgi:transcription elongation factor GreA-like protein